MEEFKIFHNKRSWYCTMRIFGDKIMMEFKSKFTQCFFESKFIDEKGALSEFKVMKYVDASYYPTLI